MTLSSAGWARLTALREARGSGFRSEDPATGTDETGAVEITIDPTGWVTAVRLISLPPELRETAAFTEAVRSAYVNAQTARTIADLRLEPPAKLEERRRRGRELLEGRRPPTVRRVRPPAPIVRPSGPVSIGGPLEPPAGTARHVGRSREGEITVTITRGNGLVAMQVSPEWLARTDPETAHHALREAFAAAYQEGERA